MNNYICTERVNLFEPNVYIQYLVQIMGNPMPEALITSVQAAFANNEATMSRIVLDKGSEVSF